MFDPDLLLAFCILPVGLGALVAAILIGSWHRISKPRKPGRQGGGKLAWLVIAVLLQTSQIRAFEAEEPCFECEAPPAADINTCTFGDDSDDFYLGTSGPGTKYDPVNDLYYGFALRDVNPAPFRSDYSSDEEGTPDSPLKMTDCFLFSIDETFQVAEGCLSHHAERAWNYPGISAIDYTGGENFWVMSINNEDLGGWDESWEDPVKDSFHACNAGPPNLSFRPNRGSTLVGGDGYDFDLALDLEAFHTMDKQVSCGEYSAPFFGFGAQCKRGNPHPVAYINTDKSKKIPSVLKFRSQVAEYHEDAIAIVYRLMVIAEWKGVDSLGQERMMDRMIFLDLTHPMSRPGVAWPINEHLLYEDWVWPAKNSFYFPGADLGFLEAGKMLDTTSCSESLRQITELREYEEMRAYEIDLSELYECADAKHLFKDSLPRNKTLAVKGVHWVIEGLGTEGELTARIQDMDIVYSEPKQILVGTNSDCSDDRTEFISNGSSVDVNICLHGLIPVREQTLFWSSPGVHVCNEETRFEPLGPDWVYEDEQWRTTIPLSSNFVEDVTVCSVDSTIGQINTHHFKIRQEQPQMYVNTLMSCDDTTPVIESRGKALTLEICARGLPLEKDRDSALGFAQVTGPLQRTGSGRAKNEHPDCDLLPAPRFAPLGDDWSPVNDRGVSKTRIDIASRGPQEIKFCLLNRLTDERTFHSVSVNLKTK